MSEIQNAVLEALKKITINIEELVGLALQVQVQQPKPVKPEKNFWESGDSMFATLVDYKKFYESEEEEVEGYLVTGKVTGAQVTKYVFRKLEDAQKHLQTLDSGTIWRSDVKKGKGTLWGRKPFAIYLYRERIECRGYEPTPKKKAVKA